MSDDALQRAIKAGGGVTKLARELGISHQAVLKWRRLPAERTLEVERLTGVPRYDLRPDLYPSSQYAVPQAADGVEGRAA